MLTKCLQSRRTVKLKRQGKPDNEVKDESDDECKNESNNDNNQKETYSEVDKDLQNAEQYVWKFFGENHHTEKVNTNGSSQ